MFWLFYHKGRETEKTITDAVATDAVHTTDLAAPDETKGVIQIAPPDTTRAPHPFVITGLKPVTQYSFFLRIIHPETTAANPTKPNADERIKYARDTAVVHGTSSSTGWYVSTLATGFNNPQGIADAKDGTAYIADKDNHVIKQVTTDGTVSIIAGNGTVGHKDTDTTKGETGTDAQFNFPYGIALAPDGNTLYVADALNNRIRTIVLSGTNTVSTIPINISRPVWVAASSDALYTSKDINNIRKIALSSPYAEGTIAMSGRHISITTINVALVENALYLGGSIWGVSSPVYEIRRVSLSGGSSVITSGFYPSGLALAPDGTLYVTDLSNHVIKRLTLNADGSLKATIIIAGDGKAGNTEGIGTKAQFNKPTGIAAAKDKDGDTILYVVDLGNNSIRKLEYKE